MLTSIDQVRAIIQLAGTSGPIRGYCPYCGAKCHASTSTRGARFLALDAGEIHTNPICVELSTQKKTPDISVTDFESIFFDLFRCRPSNKTDEESATEGHIEEEETENTNDCQPTEDKEEEEPAEGVLVPIRSLQAISKSQMMIGGPDQVTGNGKLIAEYVVRPSWLHWVTQNGISMKGCKIYEAFFLGAIETNNTLQYALKWDDHGQTIYIRLQLHADNKTFSKFCEKFCCLTTDAHGRTKLVPKEDKRKMLVAGVWNAVDCKWKHCQHKEHYGCGTCLGVLSSAATSMRQFYFIKK